MDSKQFLIKYPAAARVIEAEAKKMRRTGDADTVSMFKRIAKKLRTVLNVPKSKLDDAGMIDLAERLFIA